MKLLLRLVAIILSVSIPLMGGCQIKGDKPKENIVSATRYIGQARGFFVSTGGGEFPTNAATTTEAQRQELSGMVNFAAKSGLNSIFFEARQGTTAMYDSKQFSMDGRIAGDDKDKLDPLGYLCAEAAKSQVQVYAVINPFSMAGVLPSGGKNPFEKIPVSGEHLNPTSPELHSLVAKDAAELAKKYNVAGIVISGMDAAFMQGSDVTAAVEKLTVEVSKAVKRANPSTAVAIYFDATNEHNAMTVEVAQRLAQSQTVDMIIPSMNTTLEYDGELSYLPLLDIWSTANFGTADLYTANVYIEGDPYQIQNQLLANAMQKGVAGSILSPYSYLVAADAKESEMLISLLAAGKVRPTVTNLDFPQTLDINYPTNDATVYESKIYVMGTSDPSQPLTINGKDITRIGKKGAYGVEVPLEVGSNTITIMQGENKATVKVNRGSASTGIVPIKQITDATLFPTTPLGVDSNATVEISCVGPGGAPITATVGGNTIVLSQTTQTTATGNPATFKGSVTLNPADYPADKVTNAGKVTYVVSIGEEHTVQTSEAEVFVAGKDVPLVLEIPQQWYIASVLTDISSDDNFTQSLKSGGRAAIKGRVTATRNGNPVIAYKLSNGGYVLGSRANIVSDAALCSSDITEIIKTAEGDWEQYTFKGGQPAVLTERTETTLKLRLLDTKLTADPQVIGGGIIEKVERTDTGDGVELLLTFPADSLWGYDITHGGGSTTLYLRHTPVPSETFGKPLEGISIMLDPGHGGSDPGALGVAGSTGPTEAILNMAVANVTKFRLEQLGAQVTMTRADESARVSLDERTFMAEELRPHIFIAIHHNSTVLNRDLADVRRMEAYYWESIAKELSNSLMNRLTDRLGRKPSDPQNAYYYVTRLTFAPAVLFEMGFVVNPAEYEDACSAVSMYKAANGIAEAVIDMVG